MLISISNMALPVIAIIGLVLLFGCISFIGYFIFKNRRDYPKDGIEALIIVEVLSIMIFGIVLYVFLGL